MKMKKENTKPLPDMDLSEELQRLIISQGADLCGFADLTKETEQLRLEYGEAWKDYPYAISFAINFPHAVVDQLLDAPTLTYLAWYDKINDKLNEIALLTTNWLEARGYAAFPIPASQRAGEDKLAAIFSHRAAARLAGLGWIGKSGNLNTPDRGPRQRLATILTDAHLVTGEPIEKDCGNCTACRDICPAQAILGVNWSENQDLKERLNPEACDRYLNEMRHTLGKRICGLCLAVCPWGRK